MSGAREQVARLLALVPYLNTHPEVALEQACLLYTSDAADE